MNSIDLSNPTRQSVKGLALIFVQGLRQSLRMFWPLVLLVVFQYNIFENKMLLAITVLVILALQITHSILYYLNFYFYLKNGEFILKKGYLRKKILTIPLDRIQSVNTKQNLLQQVLNVVSLEIDTAGTTGKELRIHALDKIYANELQNQLQLVKVAENEDNTREATEKSEDVILKLSPIDLLKIGISQNHFRTALIILAFGFQIFQKIEDIFKEKADEYSNEMLNYVSGSSWALIAFLLIFFLLVSVVYSLLSTLLKYFEFTLTKKEESYRIESGLVNKRNISIPFHKVQELNWETGPIKKQFGIYNLVFKQAVSGQSKKTQLVDAPGCLTDHLESLKTDIFGNDNLSDIPKIHSDKYYFRRLWIFSGIIPTIFAALIFYDEWIFWLSGFVWLLLSAGYSYLILRKRYFRINNTQVRISKGAISHKWKQMELFKIQAVEFKQTIFQKRRSLASLQLMNASGSITIPYINETLAKEIYNYLLYHTELSKNRWM